MKEKINKFKQDGAIALTMVIMVTTLTVVSSVAISLVNINDLLSNYHLSEADKAAVNLDSCLSDGLLRIASSTSMSGSFSYDLGGIPTNEAEIICGYQISATVNNIKTVTSTATTTSDFGLWVRGIVTKINVAEQPLSIISYKDLIE